MAASAIWQKARDAVRRDLWRPGTSGVPDATVDECIHAACREIEAERRWLWLEVLRQSDTFSGSRLNLPADCGAVNSVSIIRPDGVTRDILEREQLDRVRYLSETVAAGTWPRCYARQGGDLFLDADAPDDSKIEMQYSVATPEDVDEASAATTNVTLEKHFKAACALACFYVATTYLKDDAEATRQNAAYTRILDRMIEEDEAEQTDNQGSAVRGDTYYHDLAFGTYYC